MAVTLTFTGTTPITLEPGQSLWLQSASNTAAVVQAVYPGSGAITATLDTDSWGSDWTTLTTDPRGAPADASEKAAWLLAEQARAQARSQRPRPLNPRAFTFFDNLRRTPTGPGYL